MWHFFEFAFVWYIYLGRNAYNFLTFWVSETFVYFIYLFKKDTFSWSKLSLKTLIMLENVLGTLSMKPVSIIHYKGILKAF